MGRIVRRQWTTEWECRARLTYRGRVKREQVHPSGCGWEAQGGSRDVTTDKQRPTTRTTSMDIYVEILADWWHQDSIRVKLQALDWGIQGTLVTSTGVQDIVR